LSEVICNTSPMQYLHQLELLHILPKLAGQIIVPEAVITELQVGRELGLNLPAPSKFDWVTVRKPSSFSALNLVINLGPGETEVLMLALESSDPLVILDDGLARRMAKILKIRLTGTLGLLIDAKNAGLIAEVKPLLNQLHKLGFRLAPMTRTKVLKIANELA